MRRVGRQQRKPLRRGRRRSRRLRQRWRWVPLPIRLRFAQVRNRWIHRRALSRVAVMAVLVVFAVTQLTREDVAQPEVVAVSVPDGHRVVSVPVDERIPPVDVGDEIDFYLAPTFRAGLESDAAGVVELGEPGVVISVVGESLAVAVPEEVTGQLMASLAEDAVLVVKR